MGRLEVPVHLNILYHLMVMGLRGLAIQLGNRRLHLGLARIKLPIRLHRQR